MDMPDLLPRHGEESCDIFEKVVVADVLSDSDDDDEVIRNEMTLSQLNALDPMKTPCCTKYLLEEMKTMEIIPNIYGIST